MTTIDRKAYAFVDWMSDVGGLAKSIGFLAAFFMFFAKFDNIEWHLVAKLFTRRDLA